MFDFCGEPDFTVEGGYVTSCYIAFYFAFIMLIVLLLGSILLPIYICFLKKTRSIPFICRLLKKLLLLPVKDTFCQHLSQSDLLNAACFYSLVLSSIFASPLIHIVFNIRKMIDDPGKYTIFVSTLLSTFFRVYHLFIIFVAMEVILLRSHYIKKNKVNLLSSAVSISERTCLARFIFKKALIVATILFLFETTPIIIYIDFLNGNNNLTYITRFMESLLVLSMGIPRLKLLNYEKLLIRRSKYISLTSHRDALILNNLEELALSKENLAFLIEEVSESACLECENEGTLCSHLFREVIEHRFNFMRNKLVEQHEIAHSNLPAMLPTNARNTVRSLKIILMIILLDFAINSVAFGLLTLNRDLGSGLEMMVSLMRAVSGTLRLVDTPIFLWVVLDEKKAFGEFHSVLESEELSEREEPVTFSGDFLGRSTTKDLGTSLL